MVIVVKAQVTRGFASSFSTSCQPVLVVLWSLFGFVLVVCVGTTNNTSNDINPEDFKHYWQACCQRDVVAIN